MTAARTNSDKQRDRRNYARLNTSETRRQKILKNAWMFGLISLAKIPFAVIVVLLGEFSITLITAPIFAVLWVYYPSEWNDAKKASARLSSAAPTK